VLNKQLVFGPKRTETVVALFQGQEVQMTLRERLFGKTERRLSPMLQAMEAEIPRWPPEHQRILKRIVNEASAARVSSFEDFRAFLNSHPDLQDEYEAAMAWALGSGRR
jgi:glucan phosphorylase